MITRLLVATTALALSTFTAAAQTREAKITFFIWAGSNQGVVPQEVIQGLSGEESEGRDRGSRIQQHDHLPQDGGDQAHDAGPAAGALRLLQRRFHHQGRRRGHVGEARPGARPEHEECAEGFRPAGRTRRRLHDVGDRHPLQQERRQGAADLVGGRCGIRPIAAASRCSTTTRAWWRSRRGSTAAARRTRTRASRSGPTTPRTCARWSTPTTPSRTSSSRGDAWMAPWFSAIAKVWIEEGAPLGLRDPEGRRDRLPAVSRHGQRRHAGAAGGVRGPDQRAAARPENSGRYGTLTKGIPLVTNAKLSRGAGDRSDPQPGDRREVHPARLRSYRRGRGRMARALGPRSEVQAALSALRRMRGVQLAAPALRVTARSDIVDARCRIRRTSRKSFGDFVAVDDISFGVAEGQLLLAARSLGLRQVDDAADDERVRASRPRRAAHRRRGHGRRSALSPADQHGVPALGAVSAHDGRRQCRVRPRGRAAAAARDPRARRPGAGAGRARRTSRSASRASSPAGRCSASRWRARW